MSQYANPDKLVTTDWLAENLDAPNVRIVESNEDLLLYDTGHSPGAVHIDWRRDLNDQTTRDYVGPIDFARLPTIAIVAWLIYAETIDIWVFVGAAIIFGGNYLNIWTETRRRVDPVHPTA